MKILLLLFVVAVLIVVYFFFQGRRSASLPVTVVAGEALPACGSRPNCVRSEPGTKESHRIDPLPSLPIASVAAAVESIGGVVQSQDDGLLHATFTSGVFGFVDDLWLRRDGEDWQVRSSSRVGYSDMGANRKRVERLAAALTKNASQ